MYADFPEEQEATDIGEAIACLTALSRLEIESPTLALVTALTPHLPALSLRHLSLDMRAEGYQGVSDFKPYVNEFACNALHLKHLTTLHIRAFNVTSDDISALTRVLQHNTGLEKVVFALLGNQKQQALQADKARVTNEERKVLVGLCSALRALPLHTLGLELDAWLPETAELLFQPTDGGLSPDPCWSKLTSFTGCVITPWSPDQKHVCGDALFHALAASKQLEFVSLNKCQITEDIFKVRSFSPVSSACK